MNEKPAAVVSVKYERKCNPELYLPGWSYESIGAAVELWDNVSADETLEDATERLQQLAEERVQAQLADKIKKLQARSKRTVIEANRSEITKAICVMLKEMGRIYDVNTDFENDAEMSFFDALAEIIAKNAAI